MDRLELARQGVITKKIRLLVRQRPALLLIPALAWVIWVIAVYYSELWHLASGTQEGPHFYGDPTLPYARQAITRAAVSLTGVGVLLSSATLLGLGTSRLLRWQYANWREGVPAGAALGIAIFANLGLALAQVGLYHKEILRYLVAIPLIAGYVTWLRNGRPLPRTGRLRGPANMIRGPWLLCAGLAIVMALIAALAPEWQYDALWYHLYFPRLYLEQGRLVDLVTEYPSLYPMTWELWFGYGLSFGGQGTATLLHFACLPLTALVVYELARRHIPTASPWLAVALFVTVPTVMWETATANIDLAVAFHFILLVYALVRYTAGVSVQWLLLAGTNLGLLLASKHLGLYILPVVSAWLALRLWFRERRLWPALGPVLLLGALSLLFPLPWYLRSWLASGNPVFPVLYSVLGAPPDRWNAATEQYLATFLAHFGRPRTLWNLLTLPWHLTMHAAAYDGSLGPLFLMLLPLLTFARRRQLLAWLFGLVAVYVGLWSLPLVGFQARMLVPISPILAVLAAAAFARLSALVRIACGRPGVLTLNTLFGLLLVLNLPPFTRLHERDRVGWDGWLNNALHGLPVSVVIGAESRSEYLTRLVPTYAAWRFTNRTLPEDARILVFAGGDQFYSNRERVAALSALARSTALAPAGAELYALQGLARLGITHVLVDRNFLVTHHVADSADWDDYALTGHIARTAWYDVLYEDEHAILYRIRWEQLHPVVTGGPP